MLKWALVVTIINGGNIQSVQRIAEFPSLEICQQEGRHLRNKLIEAVGYERRTGEEVGTWSRADLIRSMVYPDCIQVPGNPKAYEPPSEDGHRRDTSTTRTWVLDALHGKYD